MSTLLDLPPELIEHIYILYEDSIWLYCECEDTRQTCVANAPLFRLTNHYIQQCTRRMFAKTYFNSRRIQTSEDASIRRFCDIAHFPELTRYVSKLEFYVANDQRGLQEDSSAIRNEFVDALRAYSAVREFKFFDTSRKQVDDQHREARTDDHLDAPASRDVFDMSSPFYFVLSLAAEAGMRPTLIHTLSCNPSTMPLCGLADCFALAERKDVVSELKHLGIDIVPPRPEDGVTPEKMGLRLARQLEAGLSNMSALKTLDLSFHIGSATGISAWNILANVPKFSNLEELKLHGSHMSFHDMAKFVLKQADALKYLVLSTLCLHECNVTDMSLFYVQLSIASRLEEYRQKDITLATVIGQGRWIRYLGLPPHLCVVDIANDENEDGYIEVDISGEILHWKGHPGVKDKLLDLSVGLF